MATIKIVKVLPVFILVCAMATMNSADEQMAETEPEVEKIEKLDDLKVEVIKQSKYCGHKVQEGDIITMHAIGKIRETNEVFENSRKIHKPLMVQYVPGSLIEGVYEGINQMCAGEKRLMDIPANQGFGNVAYTSPHTGVTVPANTDITFEIEMLDITETPSGDDLYKSFVKETNRGDIFTKKPQNATENKRRGVSIKMLNNAIFAKLTEESKRKQLAFPVNDVMKEVVLEGLTLCDKDKDGYLNKEEFTNSIIFKQEEEMNKHLEELYKQKMKEAKEREKEKESKKDNDDKKVKTEL